MRLRRLLLVVGMLAGAPLAGAPLAGAPLAAQQDPIARGFDLERRGNYSAAAEAYLSVLKVRPADANALLGLERVLGPINRSDEIFAPLHAALALQPQNSAIYGIAIRVWSAAGHADSARRAVEQWAELEPDDESPFREWGNAALARRDRITARAAFLLGRERLHRPDALAAELAQLASGEGDYTTALREWVAALRYLAGYHGTAVVSLMIAPDRQRPELLKQLELEPGFPARRLEAELRARWGDPMAGYRALTANLPDDRAQTYDILRQYLDVLKLLGSPASRQAQALTLEALIARSPAAQTARLRLEAAQAYADAGNRDAARRMLDALAQDKNVPETVATGAATTLVGLTIDEGKIDDAEKRLRELAPRIGSDNYALLYRRIIAGWVRAGRLDRADSALAADSTVDGLALAGRVRLYRGDIAGAKERLRDAGPFAGTRDDATARTILLGMLEQIEADSLPALGAAFLALDRGDTASAVKGFTQIAGKLPPPKGGAELTLMAGRIEVARREYDAAEQLFRAADTEHAPSTAPAAELELARLLTTRGRGADAVTILEHLILAYPNSALVPLARRALDEARGAVPRT